MKTFTLSEPQGSRGNINFEKELNAEQLAVVTGGDGAVLVLAGAGSGKTRTLVYRVAYLLAQGVRPDEILLLTFTNKAAREMLDRTAALIGRPLYGLWGGTFHHICHQIIRECRERIGLPEKFTILDEDDAKDLIKIIVKETGVDTTEKRFPSAGVLKSLFSYASNASRPLASVVEKKYPSFLELMPDLEHVRGAYDARKRIGGTLDFDDLLVMTRTLLLQSPDVRQKYAERFRYVLVDEFQDTNTLQADIVAALGSVHKNILVVGDDAQSIYSFRAADIKNILDFPKRFPDSKMFRLETNYRSSPQILNLANQVISGNARGFAKELKSVRGAGDKPYLVAASSAREEAAFVAEMMLKMRDEGTPLSEMCTLFRASHHSQTLEFELMKRDIPYEYRGGLKFFERAHIKDVLAFARIISNLTDEMAWMRILQFGRGIGYQAARKAFGALPGSADIHEASSRISGTLGPKARAGWQEIEGIVKKAAPHNEQPSELIRAVAASKYVDILIAEYPNWEERQNDIEQLAIFAERYQEMAQFLADVSLQDGMSAMRRDGADLETERVVLSTIHQAKGLEWNSVFIIHLADQYFPNRKAMLEEEGLEEERRLFYVAVTRAKDNLFLSYPATVGEETLALVQPSIFLDEITPNLVEKMELQYKGQRRAAPSQSQTEWLDDDVVEVDALGEPKKKLPEPKRSFLREIDELGR